MKCVLCSDYKGAIVRARFLKQKKKHWVHIVCVNYMTGIWFTNKEARNAANITEVVKDTTKVDGRILQNLKSSRCSICRVDPKT